MTGGAPSVPTSAARLIRTVCVVGSGGREHALAVVLARTADVVVTPGNPGITGRSVEGHTITSVATPVEQIEADLYVIGPEVPLVDGLADRLRADGRLVFGPGADGAQLEGSKAFMKEMLAEAGIPTAQFGAFEEVGPALEFLRSLEAPWVVKTDGLAAGKGVLVTDSLAEAEADVMAKLSGDAFGSAGRRVVIEEGLTGPECSLLVLCDGQRLAALAPAQDFKRRDDDDLGPNTGGMGAFSPVPSVDDALVESLVAEAVAPLVVALRARGIDYRGVLYAGLMLTPTGPKVLEFNVRFGDPETQVVLPVTTATCAPCWPKWQPGPWSRRRGSSPILRSAWCWPPRAIPRRPALAIRSEASTRPGPFPASPSCTPGPLVATRTTTASSPRAAGCWA